MTMPGTSSASSRLRWCCCIGPQGWRVLCITTGVWGTVVCLQGVLENVTYSLDDGVLRKKDVLQALPKSMVPRPTVRSTKSATGASEALVTLHFYHPALKDLNGLVLYDLATGSAMTCNETAPTASIHLPASNYRRIGGRHSAMRRLQKLPMCNAMLFPNPMPMPLNA